MVIEEEDFKLEFNDINHKFDLYLMYVVNAKNPEKRREEFKLFGYGMSLKNCMDKIINKRISTENEVLSLKEYVKLYKEELDKLAKIVDLIK